MTSTSLEAKYRSIVGIGHDAVVLAEGHKSVLYVTRHLVGERIKLLAERFKPGTFDESYLQIPKLVTENVDLASLIDPKAPAVARKKIRQLSATIYSELWTKNAVFIMPRYDGSLEDLSRMRFKEDSIEKLESTIKKCIDILHGKSLAHRDIACRNIFYTGTYPNLQFYLGDFGSIKENDEKARDNDLMQLRQVVTKAKEILQQKKRAYVRTTFDGYKSKPFFSKRLQEKSDCDLDIDVSTEISHASSSNL